MLHAGIAGDGIMGQLLAFSLMNAGWHVTLFGRKAKDNCSMAAAGLLNPVAELEKNDLTIFHLGLEALQQHWPAILTHLAEPIYFKQLGSLVLSHAKDNNELKRFIQIISQKLNNNYYQAVNQDEIHALEPAILNFHNGYYFPCDGQIDNQMLLQAMKKYLLQKKITWLQSAEVTCVKSNTIMVADQSHHFDYVFDCRGLGAKEIFSDLRSVRGELIWLHAPDVSLKRPIRFLHPRYSLYLVPRPDHIYLIGASEIEAEDAGPISVRTTLELLTAAYSVQQNFAEARIIKTVTHCRPTLADNLPKIKYADHYIAINGLYRHGFLLAPTLAVEVMQWIQHGMSAVRYPHLFEQQEIH